MTALSDEFIFHRCVSVSVDHDGNCDWEGLVKFRKDIPLISNAILENFSLENIRPLLDSIKERYVMFWKELDQIAKISNTNTYEMLALNMYYDFCRQLCSCTALAVESRRGPLHCHCLDWELKQDLLKKYITLFHFHKYTGETICYSIGWPGFAGIYFGMVPECFSITMNAAWSEDIPTYNYPLGYFIRKLCFKKLTYSELLFYLKEQPMFCDCIFLITGMRPNEMAVVERTPVRGLERKLSETYLIVTNHYEKLEAGSNVPGYKPTGLEPFGIESYSRYKEVINVCNAALPIKIEDFQRLLVTYPFTNDLTINRTIFDVPKGEIYISPVCMQNVWINGITLKKSIY